LRRKNIEALAQTMNAPKQTSLRRYAARRRRRLAGLRHNEAEATKAYAAIMEAWMISAKARSAQS
jgi:hypothetical protein